MKALADKHSDFYYRHGSRVLPMLQARVGTGDYRLYTLEDFTETIKGKPREDVMGCLTSEPIVIFGESNIAIKLGTCRSCHSREDARESEFEAELLDQCVQAWSLNGMAAQPQMHTTTWSQASYRVRRDRVLMRSLHG